MVGSVRCHKLTRVGVALVPCFLASVERSTGDVGCFLDIEHGIASVGVTGHDCILIGSDDKTHINSPLG